MRNRRQDNAIDRAKIAKKAKPLGDLIVAAARGTIPPPPLSPPIVQKVPGVGVSPGLRKAVGKKDAHDNRGERREATVLHDCLRWLKQRGVFAWRNNSGTLWANGQPVRFGYPGSPDVVGLLPDGRFLGVECKSKTGKQSSKQKAFEAKVKANNGVYILARSVEDLERELG